MEEYWSPIANGRVRSHGGFTVIELLVIMAILGILGALSLSVFARTREATYRATCASHLMSIGLALRQYMADYPRVLPPGAPANNDCSWANPLVSYLGRTDILECPSEPEPYGQFRVDCPLPACIDTDCSAMFFQRGSYSYNDMSQRGRVVYISTITQPEGKIIALDGNEGKIFRFRNLTTLTVQDLRRAGVLAQHGEGDNVLFVDGHVKWLKIQSLTEPSLWLPQ